MSRSLAVEFDAKKARQNALKDWKRDTRGAKTMFVTSSTSNNITEPEQQPGFQSCLGCIACRNFELFFDSFFELADLWCVFG